LLMGPTASGKTAVALEIAKRFPVEIISVDSAQVYRDMDVGTAKPTNAERAEVAQRLGRGHGETSPAGRRVAFRIRQSVPHT